ncbi:MAG TPA: DUF3617 family protein [Burkholderiales bacterium]
MKRLFAMLGLLALPGAALAAGVQPGRWELTVDVSLSRGSSSGPIVETRCIGEEEARDPRRVLADAGHPGCVFSDTRDTGAEYTFSIDCRSGPVPLHGSGRMRYTAQTLDGSIDLVAEQNNLRIVTHSTVKGRRLGSCHS